MTSMTSHRSQPRRIDSYTRAHMWLRLIRASADFMYLTGTLHIHSGKVRTRDRRVERFRTRSFPSCTIGPIYLTERHDSRQVGLAKCPAQCSENLLERRQRNHLVGESFGPQRL